MSRVVDLCGPDFDEKNATFGLVLRGNQQSLRFAIFASLVSLLASTADAIECHDARVTNAIKLAAGRMPNPGECNLANYRVPPGHAQFESVVKEALLAIQKEAVNGRLPSQKLGRLPDVVRKIVN